MRSIHFSRAVLEPWAILPESLPVIVEIVTRHFSGEKLDVEEVQTRIHGAKRPEQRIMGQVAVLPLFGTIFPRANLFTELSGATSAEIFGKDFDKLVNDPAIGAIVLDVDSPGGQVSGINELSAKILEARGKKPILAVANYMMASAAYWIGTAADEVIVSPSGEVGSIGAIAIHEDVSEQLAQSGVKVSLISEGKYKTAGNPYQPLEEEARGVIQERVAEVYSQFVEAVARNRGVKSSVVRNGFGEGGMVGAKQAVELGMADRIATMDEVIAGLQKNGAGVSVVMGFDPSPVIQTMAVERSEVKGMKEEEFSINENDAPIQEGETKKLNVPGEEATIEPVAEESGEAHANDNPEDVVAVDADIQSLRNYVLIFGPAQSGGKVGE